MIRALKLSKQANSKLIDRIQLNNEQTASLIIKTVQKAR